MLLLKPRNFLSLVIRGWRRRHLLLKDLQIGRLRGYTLHLKSGHRLRICRVVLLVLVGRHDPVYVKRGDATLRAKLIVVLLVRIDSKRSI